MSDKLPPHLQEWLIERLLEPEEKKQERANRMWAKAIDLCAERMIEENKRRRMLRDLDEELNERS